MAKVPAKLMVGGGSSSTPVSGETPSTVNATTFTLAHTPVSGSLRLFLDGVRITAFSLTGTTITLSTAKLGSQDLLADYSY